MLFVLKKKNICVKNFNGKLISFFSCWIPYQIQANNLETFPLKLLKPHGNFLDQAWILSDHEEFRIYSLTRSYFK